MLCLRIFKIGKKHSPLDTYGWCWCHFVSWWTQNEEWIPWWNSPVGKVYLEIDRVPDRLSTNCIITIFWECSAEWRSKYSFQFWQNRKLNARKCTITNYSLPPRAKPEQWRSTHGGANTVYCVRAVHAHQQYRYFCYRCCGRMNFLAWPVSFRIVSCAFCRHTETRVFVARRSEGRERERDRENGKKIKFARKRVVIHGNARRRTTALAVNGWWRNFWRHHRCRVSWKKARAKESIVSQKKLSETFSI